MFSPTLETSWYQSSRLTALFLELSGFYFFKMLKL